MKKAWGWLVFCVALLLVIQFATSVIEPLLPFIIGGIVVVGLAIIGWKVYAFLGKRRRFFQ